MAAYNVYNAVFDGTHKRAVVVPPAWQWDTGQVLRISGTDFDFPSKTQVQFTVNGETLTSVAGVIDGVATVSIPDAVFENEGNVPVYIYVSEDDATAETLYTAMLTVRSRSKPEDYSDPTEAEQTMFQQAIDATAASAQEAAEHADDAEDYAKLAESWAVGGTGTRDGENIDNAKFYAERAAMGADKTGWLWSEFNQETGILRIVVSDDLKDEMTFNVDYSTGRMEITIV